ncbi:MAG: D-alanyl-D-alanine carboxypeptidase [Pseudomonadota bacterium]|nr:D-alanyl-D-alanine carboxypeptidase [Pseudomonadota bacterium]
MIRSNCRTPARRCSVVAVTFVFAFASLAASADSTVNRTPAAAAAVNANPSGSAVLAPQAPAIGAKSWLLLDVASNQPIAGGNPDARIEPASLTKLMTAYLAFKALRQKAIALHDMVTVSTHAWKAEGSRMFIEPERPVSVDELIHGVIIQSGNDASIALAERIAGSEGDFAQLMNKEAAALGMTGTHFVNATGLPDPQHYSTARDLARVARAIQHDFPDFYPIYGQKEYRYNNIRQPNRNRLLWTDPSVDGMKTGHTDSAGFCLVASAQRSGRRLLSVVVGTESESARSLESEKLLNYGFQYYDTQRLYAAGTVLRRLPVFKAHSDLIDAGFRQDVWLTLPKTDFAHYKETFRAKEPLVAPIAAGQVLGTLEITVDGRAVASLAVESLAEVPTGNLLQRAWGALRLMTR